MKKLSRVLSSVLVAFMLFPTIVSAETINPLNNKTVTEYGQYLIIEDEKGIDIIDQNLLNEKIRTKRMVERYYTTNKVSKGTMVDKNKLITILSGEPGMNLKLGLSQSVSSQISGTFGASSSEILQSLGISSSYTVTSDSNVEYLVPATENGRKVSRAEVRFYPLYQVFSYDVMYRMPNGTKDQKKGTGEVKKPIGLHIAKSLYYK